MSDNPQDRRREKRKNTQETLTLQMETGGRMMDVPAILIDVSEGGFRARHGNLRITGSQEVRFLTKTASGKARAVWNRILGDEVETGFVVTERE